MEFEPMLTPREKSPLPKMSPEEDRTRDAVDSEPKHYQLSYSGPLDKMNMMHIRPTVSTINQIPSKTFQGCEKNGAEVFAFLHYSDLESKSKSLRLVSKDRVQYYISSGKVWIKIS